MKQKALKIIRHPLVYGSSIVVIGGLVANFFNFLFNLFMSRNLSIADYGILASVISMISFPSLVTGAVAPLVTNFAASYFALNQLDKVRGLYIKIIKLLFLIGILVTSLFFIFIPQISGFFHIENRTILLITDLIIFLAFIGIVNMSLLQAKLAFGFQVFLNFLVAVTKLAFGVVFVFAGLSVTGAVSSMLIASTLGFVVSFYPVRFIFNRKIISPPIDKKELFAYGIPSALTLFGLTSLISTDIILVKHFFTPVNAGYYAGLALIGKVIFFLSAPITTVMFPIVVQQLSRSEKFTNTLKFSLLLVLLPSSFFTAIYFMFPGPVILFFLKKEAYLTVAPLLGIFGLHISFYAVLSILANFYLSINKTKIYIPILIGAVLQAISITIYHQSFLQIILLSLSVTFLLDMGLLLYYPHATKKRL